MSRLQESLRRLLAVDGARTVALIDIATGMIVRSAGKPDPELAVAAACAAEEARAARSALGSGGTDPGLEEILTVTGTRLHVSRILGGAPGEGMLLFVDLERQRSNPGLASLTVSKLAPAVLA